MVNKVEMVQIEGKIYNTEALTGDTLAEFIEVVNSNADVAAVAKKYGVAQVT